MDATQLVALHTLMEELPLPSRALVDQWAEEVNGGGEATLAEADHRLVVRAIGWYKRELLECVSSSLSEEAQ